MQMIDDFKTDSLKTLNSKLHHNSSKSKLVDKSNQNALHLNDSSSNEDNNNETTSLSDGKNDDLPASGASSKPNSLIASLASNCQQFNPVCNLCNKTFANSSNLKHHMNTIHFNEAKWICKECGKVCTSKSNLKVHLRVHLRVKPYFCRWCDYNCMHHSSIRDHLSKCHPDKSHNSCEPGYIFNSSAVPEPESSIPCDIHHIKNETATNNANDSCSINNSNQNCHSHDDTDLAMHGDINFSSSSNALAGGNDLVHNENEQIGGASGRKRKRKLDASNLGSASASISPLSSVSSSTAATNASMQHQQQQQTNAFLNNMAAALFHRMNTTAVLLNQFNQGNPVNTQNLFQQAGLAPIVADNMLVKEEKKLFQNYNKSGNARNIPNGNKSVLQSCNSNTRSNGVPPRSRKNPQKSPMDLSVHYVSNKTADDDDEMADEHEHDDEADNDFAHNNGEYNDDGDTEYDEGLHAIDENNNEIDEAKNTAGDLNAFAKYSNGKHKEINGCCFAEDSEYENDAEDNDGSNSFCADGDITAAATNINGGGIVKGEFESDEIYDADENNNIAHAEIIDEEVWSNESLETATIKIPPKANTNRRKSQMVVRKRVYSETSTAALSPPAATKSSLLRTNGCTGNNLCKRLFPHLQQAKNRKNSNMAGKVSRDTQTYFISMNESNEFYGEQEKLAQLLDAPTLITTSTSTSTSISTSTTTTTTINNGVSCPQSVAKAATDVPESIPAENICSSSNCNSTLSCNNSNGAQQVHNKVDFYKCTYCNIIFNDYELYSLHMGMHGTNNPWQCNVCSNVCLNKIDFAVHILHLPKK